LLKPGGSEDPKVMLQRALGGTEPSLEPFFEDLLGAQAK